MQVIIGHVLSGRIFFMYKSIYNNNNNNNDTWIY